MSKVIDERVVEMRFDNKNYEKNAKQSMETTEKLKKSLNFEGVTKGLGSLNTAMDGISQHFSFKEIARITALNRAINSTITTGKKMISALTIDPVKTGLSEYETKINSIQTIMSNTASKGTTMADVTEALNELNTYADKTIYNFAEMTRNIGTFTAAGIDLDSATKAIQGISNLAAASGSTTQQASTAMYQLSQALSTGTVRLMDWNSVVNASMGGELFQNALKDTAREMGVAVDDIIEKSGSFRESLSENWLSADILNTTLKKFTTEGAKEYADSMVKSGKYTQEQADALLASAQSMEDAATKVKTFTQLWDTLKESAQSGWSQTWEILIGDFEQAREVLSDLSDLIGGAIGKSADSRNKMLSEAFSSKWPEFTAEINKAGVATKDFEEKLKEVAKKHGISIDKMIEDQGSLAKVLSSGELSTGIIVETLKSFIGETDEASKSTENLSDKLEYFQQVVNKVWRGDYGNGKKRMEALTNAGYDYATVQALVNKTVDGHKLTLDDLSDVQLKSIGYTDEQVKSIKELAEEAEKTGTPLNELIENLQRPSGRELLFESLKNTLKGLFTVLESVGKAWEEIFPQKEQSDALYRAAVALNEFSKKLIVSDETASNLVRTFKGLFAIVDIVATVAGGALRAGFKLANAICEAFGTNIWEVTAKVGDAIVAFRDWIKEHNIITKAFEIITPYIKSAVDSIKSWISALKESDNIPRDIVLGLIKGFKEGIKIVVSIAKELGSKIIETVKEVLGIHSPSKEFFNIAKQCVQGWINGIKEGSGGALESVKGMFGKIFDWFSGLDWDVIFLGGITAVSILSLFKISKAIENLITPIENLTTPIKGFGDILTNLATGITGLFGSIMDTLSAFGKYYKSMAFEKISKGIINIAIAIGILVAAIVVLTLVDPDKLAGAVVSVLFLVGALAAIMAVMLKLTNTLGDFKETGTKTAYLAAMGITIMLIAGAIIALGMLSISQLMKGTAALAVIVLAVTALMGATRVLSKDSWHVASFDNVGKMIRRMAWSMLLMAAAIKIFGNMSIYELIQGGTVILAITGIYTLIMKAVKSMTVTIGKDESAVNTIDQAGKMMRKLAWSIILMAIAMKLISGMSWKEIAKGGTVITAIAGIYVGIMAATKLMTYTVGSDQTAVNSIEHAGKMFSRIAFSILTISLAILILGNTPTDKLIKGGIAVGLILSACVGIMAATKLLTKSEWAASSLGKLGLMFVGMGVSLLAMSLSVMMLGNLKTDKLNKGVKNVLIIMAGLAGIMLATRLLTTNENSVKAMSSVAKLMIAVSIAIFLLSTSIYAFSIIDPERLDGAVKAVTAVLLGFAAIMASTKLYQKGTTSLAPLIIIVSAMAALMFALIGITYIDQDKLKASAAAITSVMLSMALVIASTKLLQGVSVKGIFGLAIAIGAMILIMPLVKDVAAVLSDIDSTDIVANASALAIALTALAGVAIIISKMNINAKNVAKGALGIAALVPVMAMIGLVLTMMSALGPKRTLEYATALVVVLTALAGVGAIVGLIGNMAKSIALGAAGLAALVGVMALIGLVLAMMNAMNVTNVKENALVLVQVLTCLLPIAAITGALGLMVASIALGALGLAALVGVMALVVLVLNMMSDMNIENGYSNAVAVTTVLKELTKILRPLTVVGMFGPAALIGIGSLIALIAAIGVLAVGIGWLVDEFPELEEFLDKGIPILTKISTGLGEFVGGIVDGFLVKATESLPKIGENLSGFIDNATPFIDGVKGIDENVVNGVINLSKALLAIAGTEFIDAVVSKLPLIGTDSTKKIGTTIKSLGTMLVDFNKSLGKDFDAGMADKAATAMKKLTEVVNMIPTEGGVFKKIGEFFGGTKDVDGFGFMMANFATDLNTFASTVKTGGFGDESVVSAVDKAIEIANKMVELANAVPNSGGLAGQIAGNNDLSSFGGEVLAFVYDLSSISSLLSAEDGFGSLNVEVLDRFVSFTKKIIKMSDDIPNTGGVAGKLAGNNDLGTFGESLESYVTSFKKACAGISEVVDYLPEGGVFDAFMGTTTKLIELASKVEQTGGWFSKIEGDNSLSSFGDTLVPFAEDVKSFAETIQNVNPDVISKISQITDELNKALASMATVDMESAKSFDQSFSDIITRGVNKLQETVDGSLETVKNSGTKLTDAIIEGFNSETPYRDATIAVVSYMTDEAGKAPDSMYEIGVDIVEGLAQGINEHKRIAVQAAAAMALAVEEAARVNLEVNSPSKVFRRIGMSIPEGFAQGIGKLDNEVADSARSMGNNAITNLRNSIARISETVDGGMDINLTITPVIDLTNVRTGVDAIGNLLEFDSQVGVMANVGAANAAMSRRSQNGANDDVVSELAKLRKDLGKTGNTTYNVNGITYDDGSNIADAVSTLIRTARIERRI